MSVTAPFPRTLNTRLRPLALAALLLACAATQLPAQAQSTPATISYTIPAGPLAGALNRYAQQSGVAIVIDAAKVQGLSTAGLQGSYSVDEGFARLLQEPAAKEAFTAFLEKRKPDFSQV